MARTIGEGFVRVRPDTSGFGPEAERGLTAAMSRTVSRLERVLDRLEPAAARAGQAAGRRFSGGMERETSRLRGILSGLFRVGGAVALGGGMAYVTAQAIALASAVSGAAGSILLLPGVAVTAAAGLGVLAIATRGLGDALSTQSARGGGAAKAGARAVESASRAYEAAQKRVIAVTKDAARAARDLLDVRREEAERIEQLSMDVEGAALAQEAAARRVRKAEEELAAAKAADKPDQGAIDEAAFALKEANYALKEATARHEELAAEQAQSAKVGVDGSRAVQDALERHKEAQDAVAEAKREAAAAEKELARAGEPAAAGGGAVSKQAEAYAKLAPAAQAVVRTVRALTPAWEAAGRAIQQRAWIGVAGDLRGLSDRYVPVLTRRLGDVAGAWNTAARQSAKLAMSKTFVADVDTTLGNAAVTSDRLARAVAPIVSGLRHIGVVASGYLPGLAGGVLTLAERFERWSAAARESGQLQRWLSGGIAVLRQLGAIAGNVIGIVVAILRAGGAEAGGDMLSGLEAGTARLRRFLNSAEGQERIAEVLGAVRGVVEAVVAGLPALTDNAAKLAPALAGAAREGSGFRDTLSVTGALVGFVADHLDTLVTLLPWLAAGYVLVKGAQTAANLAAVAMVPIKIAEVAANWGLRASMNAHTAALTANTAATRGAAVAQATETAATNGGVLAKGRNLAATVAQRVAAVAANVATKAWAAGQWLLNAAMSANPLGLVLIAVIALVAGIVLLWRNSETFRNVVTAVWKAVWGAIKFVVDWLTNTAWPAIKAAFGLWLGMVKAVYGWVFEWLGKIVSFVGGLGAKIGAKARGMFDGIVAAAKGGINAVIDAWNRLDFELNIRVPDWVPPPFGGKGFRVPDLFPDIPRLAEGGVARARPGGMLAQIAEGGQDEVVAPLSTLAAMIAAAVREAGGGRGINIEQLIVKAFTDRFSLRQVQEELAMLGAH
ncbi:hypothetical protein [Micromonospora aurantiaca (nom. illeg.)]|uniref:hypothetical protein n=1 Tax=Micromonospora aurantiaca (nom. illeg.) TaxID=47850 RepID=UPI0033D11A79